MKPLLTYLVVDLMQDRGLRFHFNQDPEGVMKMYALDEEQKALLYSMKRKKIFAEVRSELDRWGFPDDGLPVDENCIPDEGIGAHYPSPKPAVFRIKPKRFRAGSGVQDLRIYGQSFAPNVRVEIDNGSGSSLTSIRPPDIRGTFRCSEIFMQVTAPTVEGTYFVKVFNNAGTGYEKRLKRKRLRIEP